MHYIQKKNTACVKRCTSLTTHSFWMVIPLGCRIVINLLQMISDVGAEQNLFSGL